MDGNAEQDWMMTFLASQIMSSLLHRNQPRDEPQPKLLTEIVYAYLSMVSDISQLQPHPMI